MFAAFLVAFLIRLFIFVVFSVYPSMLLLGALHDEYPAVPALSFGNTILVAALVYFLVPMPYETTSRSR